VIATIIFGLHTANLALWVKNPLTKVSVASAIIDFLAAFAIGINIILEHNRTSRPSQITSLYLVSTLTGQFVIVRTLYLRGYVPEIAAITAATASCKVVLLGVESWPKVSYLRSPTRPYGPGDKAGPVSKAFLWYLTPILLLGNRKILTLDDLDTLDHDLYSDVLRVRLQNKWEKCKSPTWKSLKMFS